MTSATAKADRATAATLLGAARASSWDVALHDVLRRADPARHREATDELSLGWRLLIDLEQADDVLEIGSRWGTATFALAESDDAARRVVALDASPEHAGFVALRAAQTGESRVSALAAPEDAPLPFDDESFDAVIAPHGLDSAREGPAFLAEAARVLRPRGQLLVGGSTPFGPAALSSIPVGPARALLKVVASEISSRASLPWTPHRAASAANRAGFAGVQVYGVLPDVARPFYLLPLDSPTVLDFFLGFVFSAYDWRLRLRKHGLERAFGVARLGVEALRRLGLRRLSPAFMPAYCLVARKADAGRQPVDSNSRSAASSNGALNQAKSSAGAARREGGSTRHPLERYLLDNWDSLSIGKPKPGRLRFLGQTFSFDKPVLLVFADEERQPTLVAKVSRSPRYNRAREQEVEHLREARRRGGALAESSIPEVVALTQIDGRAVSVERYVDGIGLNSLIASRGLDDPDVARETFDLAAGWLVDFQREARRPDVAPDRVREVCSEAFAEYVSRFSPPPELRDRLARLVDLEDVPPSVFSHGQYSAENLLVPRDVKDVDPKVIDWDWSRPDGAPLVDLFRFAWIYQFRARGLEQSVDHRDDYLSAFDDLFFGQGALTALLRHHVEAYCEALGVSSAWKRALLAFALVDEANRKHSHLLERAVHGGYWYPLQGDPEVARMTYREAIGRQLNVHLLRLLLIDREGTELAI